MPADPEHKLLLGHLIQYIFAHKGMGPVIWVICSGSGNRFEH